MGSSSLSAGTPAYLEKYYWWAYVRPWAPRVFERMWFVNLILFGNYHRLRKSVFDEFGTSLPGATLQISCCYGDLTPQLAERVAAEGETLDIVDILGTQLENLARKLPRGAPVVAQRMDSRALTFADDHFERVLLFFLLHEQPQEVRLQTVREALRVTKPGGMLVIVDYGTPALWHPVRYLVLPILGFVEPFARALWKHELQTLVPQLAPLAGQKTPYFGGLYQKLVYTKPRPPATPTAP